ncbi:hypothetical protein MBLNU230_g1329t1 [Neophaeotheca triangularis]
MSGYNSKKYGYAGDPPRGTGSPATSTPTRSPDVRSTPSTGKSTSQSRLSPPSARAFDGSADPSSPKSSARGGSVAGSQPQPVRYEIANKNVDFSMGAWAKQRGVDTAAMPKRLAVSKLGSEKKIGLNSFPVTKFPSKPVYQYEVLVGNGAEKKGLIKAVWQSKAVRKAVGEQVIFDGNRLAWSLKPLERELRLTVDLDEERGRTVKPGKEPDRPRIVIRQTNKIRFDVLTSHLEGKTDFDNSCLEAINFADHLLREYPSRQYTQIKRSFFHRGSEDRYLLSPGVEAVKGVYQSLRVVNGGLGQPGKLAVTVDVSNGTFFVAQDLYVAAINIANKRDVHDLINSVRVNGQNSATAKTLKRLRKLHVYSAHRGKTEIDHFCIDRFEYKGARDVKFETIDKAGVKSMVTIYDYYQKKYGIRLRFPDLPLVKATNGKNTLIPMELLRIEPNQRFAFKLDETQTSNMIKFAVTPPPARWKSVEHGLSMLNWANDPVLRTFGMEIKPEKTVVNSRLLVAPKVMFGAGATANPGTSGRWDLKGKKFLQPNTVPLKIWGICVVPGARGGKPDKSAVDRFVQEFIKIYQAHGGRIEEKKPYMCVATGTEPGDWVTQLWNGTGNQKQARPQMLVFILPDKNTINYGRIKRSADCRYGVVSQCMQYAHVQKCQGQYISNVCMKFNAKLGGTTARAVGSRTGGPGGAFTKPTMVIGADVSHAAPGSEAPSMAALTLSQDLLGLRYAAYVETNGFRVEMIATENINRLQPFMKKWMSDCNQGKVPSRVIYFRDGVSEGQYQHVLEQEVEDMKRLLKGANPKAEIPFTVLVGSKRHHVRFFPAPGSGDKNGNPLPGTLVETGVTHPFENDFYLCAHAAIKGTARPVHYYVLLNECGLTNDEIHTICYEQSYQYMRATTPVSIHPAIYYAHIASNRAVPHDPKWNGSSDGKERAAAAEAAATGAPPPPPSASQGGGQRVTSTHPSQQSYEQLLPMPTTGGIESTMWYI